MKIEKSKCKIYLNEHTIPIWHKFKNFSVIFCCPDFISQIWQEQDLHLVFVLSSIVVSWKEYVNYVFVIFFPISECSCNSLGSTKNDDSPCFGKCCNDDNSCKCRIGYIGSNCNQCDIGYYVTNVTNGENTCSNTFRPLPGKNNRQKLSNLSFM